MGCLSNLRGINDLAAKISLLLSDAWLREMIAKRARITAERVLWDGVARKTLETYTKVTLHAEEVASVFSR